MTPKKFLSSYPATIELVSDAVQEFMQGTALSDGKVLNCSNMLFDPASIPAPQMPMLLLSSGDVLRSQFQGFTDTCAYRFQALLKVQGTGDGGGSRLAKRYLTDIARRVFAVQYLPVTLKGSSLVDVVEPQDVSKTECVRNLISGGSAKPLTMGMAHIRDEKGTNTATVLIDFGCTFLSDNDPDYLLPGHTLSIVRRVQVDFQNAVGGIDPNTRLPDDIVLITASGSVG